jgi:hypothetical protein
MPAGHASAANMYAIFETAFSSPGMLGSCDSDGKLAKAALSPTGDDRYVMVCSSVDAVFAQFQRMALTTMPGNNHTIMCLAIDEIEQCRRVDESMLPHSEGLACTALSMTLAMLMRGLTYDGVTSQPFSDRRRSDTVYFFKGLKTLVQRVFNSRATNGSPWSAMAKKDRKGGARASKASASLCHQYFGGDCSRGDSCRYLHPPNLSRLLRRDGGGNRGGGGGGGGRTSSAGGAHTLGNRTSSSTKGSGGGGGGDKRSATAKRCFSCNKPGHFKKDCPGKHRSSGSGSGASDG